MILFLLVALPTATGRGQRQSFPVAFSAQAEECADVADEQIGLLHRGKVAATIELRPMDDVIALLGVAADGDIFGEDRDPRRRGGRALVPGAGVLLS